MSQLGDLDQLLHGALDVGDDLDHGLSAAVPDAEGAERSHDCVSCAQGSLFRGDHTRDERVEEDRSKKEGKEDKKEGKEDKKQEGRREKKQEGSREKKSKRKETRREKQEERRKEKK